VLAIRIESADMALLLKCLLLFLELSFVLSAVIVVKLDDKEDIQAIANTIESKLDKQDDVFNQLNSTFQDALYQQQEQIKQLDGQVNELKQDVQTILDSSKQGIHIHHTHYFHFPDVHIISYIRMVALKLCCLRRSSVMVFETNSTLLPMATR